jgi:8-oxo-dGTP pyrophosphatase MutT (NUDIX family)
MKPPDLEKLILLVWHRDRVSAQPNGKKERCQNVSTFRCRVRAPCHFVVVMRAGRSYYKSSLPAIGPCGTQEITMITRKNLEQALAGHVPEKLPPRGGTHAAVALIAREAAPGLQLLFIERAANENDPWSGNICFPGGKVENGDGAPRATAERETWEEVGIDLGKAHFLGRLSDIAGVRIPVHVSCFVYFVENLGPFRLMSEEVQDAFWVSLADLMDPSRHGEKVVRFDGQTMVRPGVTLPHPGDPVLWGLTYLLVMDFLKLLNI